MDSNGPNVSNIPISCMVEGRGLKGLWPDSQ